MSSMSPTRSNPKRLTVESSTQSIDMNIVAEKLKIFKREKLLDILLRSIRISLRAALLGYSIRGGFHFLVSLAGIRKNRKGIAAFIFDQLKDALWTSKDTFRFARFFGSLAFLWKGVYSLLARYTMRENSKMNGNNI
jgi:hypothetical protein